MAPTSTTQENIMSMAIPNGYVLLLFTENVRVWLRNVLDLCCGCIGTLGANLHRLHDSLCEIPLLVRLGRDSLVSVSQISSSEMLTLISASSGSLSLVVSGNFFFMRIPRATRTCSAWKMPSGWIWSICCYGSPALLLGPFNCFGVNQGIYGRQGELRCSW